jgi:hypothetical protein
MDMCPFPILIKQVIATLIVVTKKHSGPDTEQGKIIEHETSRLYIITIPGTAVVE